MLSEWGKKLAQWLWIQPATPDLNTRSTSFASIETPEPFKNLAKRWGLEFFSDPKSNRFEIRQNNNVLARYQLPGFDNLLPPTVPDRDKQVEALLAGKSREWAEQNRNNVAYNILFQATGLPAEQVSVTPESGDETSLLYYEECENLFRDRIEGGFPPMATAVLAIAMAHMEINLSEALSEHFFEGRFGPTDDDFDDDGFLTRSFGDVGYALVAAGDHENHVLQLADRANHFFMMAVDGAANTRKINVESSRVTVALRDTMKRAILQSLKDQGPIEGFPTAFWRIIGSSLFPVAPASFESDEHILSESFATPDLDIQVCVVDDISHREGQILDLKAETAMATAIKSLGLVDSKPGEWLIDEGATSPHHLYITKIYSPDEARKTLAERPDLLPFITDRDFKVTLELHTIPRTGLSSWIAPTESDAPHVRLNDPRQYLADILCRSIFPGDFQSGKGRYKPSDVIHAYKLVWGYKPDQPRVNCRRDIWSGKTDLESDQRLVRLMCVLKLAAERIDPNSVNINAFFHEDGDKREKFIRGILNYPSYRAALRQFDAQTLLKNMHDLLHLVFPPDPSCGTDSSKPVTIRLAERERQFFDAMFPKEEGITPIIKVDLLRAEYPDVFAAHPELEKNIRTSAYLAHAMDSPLSRPTRRPDAPTPTDDNRL